MIQRNGAGKGANLGLEKHETALCNRKIAVESESQTPELLNISKHPPATEEKKGQSQDRLARTEIDSFEFDGPCTD